MREVIREAGIQDLVDALPEGAHTVLGRRFGTHDLVGLIVLEHPILVDAGLMGEGVGPDNGFVGLYRKAGNRRHQTRCRNDLGGIKANIDGEHVLAGAHRHGNFLQRRVACPLAKTVNCTLDLPGAVQHSRQGVRHRQPEVIVAVN